jgi:hypothetical protein
MLPKELLIIISSYIDYDTDDYTDTIQDVYQMTFSENDYLSILKLKHCTISSELFSEIIHIIQNHFLTYKKVNYILNKAIIQINKYDLIEQYINDTLINKVCCIFDIYIDYIDFFNLLYPLFIESTNGWEDLSSFLSNDNYHHELIDILDFIDNIPINTVIPFLELLYKSGFFKNYDSEYYIDILKNNLSKNIQNLNIKAQFAYVHNDIDTSYQSKDNEIPDDPKVRDLIIKYQQYLKLDTTGIKTEEEYTEFTNKMILYFKFSYNKYGDQGISHILYHHINLLKWYLGYSSVGEYMNTRGPLDIDVLDIECSLDDYNNDYLNEYIDLFSHMLTETNDTEFKLYIKDLLIKINHIMDCNVRYDKYYNMKYDKILNSINHVFKDLGEDPDTYRILVSDNEIILTHKRINKLEFILEFISKLNLLIDIKKYIVKKGQYNKYFILNY